MSLQVSVLGEITKYSQSLDTSVFVWLCVCVCAWTMTQTGNRGNDVLEQENTITHKTV